MFINQEALASQHFASVIIVNLFKKLSDFTIYLFCCFSLTYFDVLSYFFLAGEASKLSPIGSPRKENEHHGEHSHHKKSLFSKMKDKAKKLQHSLSGKRRHDEEGDATMSPPFGRSADHQVREAGGFATLSPRDKSKDHKVREEGELEEEKDPEYLGAPSKSKLH